MLPVRPVPSLPEVRLHRATPSSHLRRLFGAGDDAPPPYWAYAWAGGIALARYILDRPRTVRGRRVLDLGAGSGLVGIAAALAGAAAVSAAEVDPNGLVAIRLNAALNGVSIEVQAGDPTTGPPAQVDVVLVGDLFYDVDIAARVTGFLDRCAATGREVLVGDPRRVHLPVGRLHALGDYPVPDFGDGAGPALLPSTVFRWIAG